MWIVKLAWKNLWRNKGRTIITIAAIFFCSGPFCDSQQP